MLVDLIGEYSVYDNIYFTDSEPLLIEIESGGVTLILLYNSDDEVKSLISSNISMSRPRTPEEVVEELFSGIPPGDIDIDTIIRSAGDLRLYQHTTPKETMHGFRLEYLQPTSFIMLKVGVVEGGWVAGLWVGEDVFSYPLVYYDGEVYPFSYGPFMEAVRGAVRERSAYPEDSFDKMYDLFTQRLPREEEFIDNYTEALKFSVGPIQYRVDDHHMVTFKDDKVIIDAAIRDPHVTVTEDETLISFTLQSNKRPPRHVHAVTPEEAARIITRHAYTPYPYEVIEEFMRGLLYHLTGKGVDLDFSRSRGVPFLVPPRIHYHPPAWGVGGDRVVGKVLGALRDLLELVPRGVAGRVMGTLAWGLHSALLGRVRLEAGYYPLILFMEGMGVYEKTFAFELLKAFTGAFRGDSPIPGVYSYYPLLVADPMVFYSRPDYRGAVLSLVETGRSHLSGVPDFSVPLVPSSLPGGVMGDIGVHTKGVILRYEGYDFSGLGDMGVLPDARLAHDSPLRNLNILGSVMVERVVNTYNRGDQFILSLNPTELFSLVLRRTCALVHVDYDEFKGSIRDVFGYDDSSHLLESVTRFTRRLYRTVIKSYRTLKGRPVDIFLRGLYHLVGDGVFPGFKTEGDDLLVYDRGVNLMYGGLRLEGLSYFLGVPMEHDGVNWYVRLNKDIIKSYLLPLIMIR